MTHAPVKAETWPGKKVSSKDAKAVHAADQENARLAEQRAKSTDGQTPSERATAQSAPRAKKAAKATKDAKPAAKRDTGKRGTKRAKRPSGLDAAAQVLADAAEPLSVKEIVALMLGRKLWHTNGKTPSATIYAAMTREIAVKGDASRFRKTGRGKFELAR